MKQPVLWIISGASSIIAESFARQAAAAGADLLLLGRDGEPLTVIANDLQCRYRIECTVCICDFSQPMTTLLETITSLRAHCYLFIAHSMQCTNEQLDPEKINKLLQVNISASIQLIHAYWQRPQAKKGLIFISSVAAAPGRQKNSLYGASKAAVEVYLQGLQQACSDTDHILVARAGFIDTHQTFGQHSLLGSASPRMFAQRLWQAWHKGHHRIYFPRYWRFIMRIFNLMPWWIYRKMGHW
ncbi:MAG: SDR family NAD(P)-dependent oxidoreductase [Legionellaceae bacterium]|nr:SDR family NAD(P)-dependent oxidoreductase [Legionellaceae bacterium]